MPEGTVLDLALVAVSAERHLGQVVLMQELARRPLHAQIPQPMSANDGAETRIVLGGRNDRLGILSGGEDAAGLPIGQRIDRFGNAMGQGKVLEVVLHLIDRQRRRREDRRGSGRSHHRCCLYSLRVFVFCGASIVLRLWAWLLVWDPEFETCIAGGRRRAERRRSRRGEASQKQIAAMAGPELLVAVSSTT